MQTQINLFLHLQLPLDTFLYLVFFGAPTDEFAVLSSADTLTAKPPG